jgi:hypothetical protein
MDIMFNIHGVSTETLPPGTQHRYTFNRSLMGLEMMSGGGGGGGGSDGPDWAEVADLQHEAATNQDNDIWEAAGRDYNQGVLINQAKRHNEETAARWKDRSAIRQWDYQSQMQEAQYNAQVKAYNRSERFYEAQIAYNTKAADMAYEQEAAVTKERYFALAYQGAAQELATDMKRAESGMKLQASRAESAFKLQDLMVKQVQGEGKVRARGRVGRSANKQYQSLVAEAGRATAQLKSQLMANDQQYNQARYGIEAERSLQKEQWEQSKLSIGEAYTRATKKIGLDEYGANLKADANRMMKPSPPIPIPRPLETPRSVIVDSMLPVRQRAPTWGSGMGPGPSGGGGGQMSGGQMAMSALATAGSVMASIPGPTQVPGAIMMGASMIGSALFG